MEIQTFFLAEQITRTANGDHDARHVGLVLLNLKSFGERVMVPGLIVLRREDTASDAPISLRFDLVDDDGWPAGHARRLRVTGIFPKGQRFFSILANIGFVFPEPGHCRLDITMEVAAETSVYHYALDIGRCEKPR